jgi:hypothetical protein
VRFQSAAQRSQKTKNYYLRDTYNINRLKQRRKTVAGPFHKKTERNTEAFILLTPAVLKKICGDRSQWYTETSGKNRINAWYGSAALQEKH